jgi:uncharacterized LabA/DUF88 family protein
MFSRTETKEEEVKRTYLYVDGDNLLGLQRERGWWIDHKKFTDYIKENYPELQEAYYYSTLDPTQEIAPKKRFLRAMTALGYRVSTRPPKVEFHNGAPYRRGCSDLLMCRDIILDLSNFDRCILVTGDGDFDCVVDTLRTSGKEYLVISSPPVIGSALLNAAGMNFLDFESIREEIEMNNNVGDSDTTRRSHETAQV